MADARWWFRVRADMHGNPKIAGLTDAGFRLLTYIWAMSCRSSTPGRFLFIGDYSLLRASGATPFDASSEEFNEMGAREITSELERRCLIKITRSGEGGQDEILVHDWQDHNPLGPPSLMPAARAEQKRKERQSKSDVATMSQATLATSVATMSQVSQDKRREEKRREDQKQEIKAMSTSPSAQPTGVGPQPTPQVALPEKQKRLGGEALQVFEHWVRVRGKLRAKFSPERRRRVLARLADGFSVADLCKAIDGVAKSSHHRGETNGHVYDDLTLICRDVAHVEQFIGFAGGAVIQRIPTPANFLIPTDYGPGGRIDFDTGKPIAKKDAQ
jgi:hypothetical protein